MHMKKRFAIVNRPDSESQHIAEVVRVALCENGFENDIKTPEAVIVIGGDGTFIYAVHQYLEQLNDVCFYGIHTGTLGFYTDYRSSDLTEFMNRFITGDLTEDTYPLLEAKTEVGTFYGINEIRIENAARTQDMKISINGKEFEKFRGTGICISTQLGSTAYNRSLGGAVIQEGLNMIQMCEISGIHHHMYRSLAAPFVMADSSVIELESSSYAGALLGVDSEVYDMKEMKHITVQISDRKVRMLRGRKISYFDRLHSLF